VERCETCKWWGFEKDEIIDTRTLGRRPLSVKECGNPSLADIDEGGYGAVPENGFGLDYPVCGLITGPQFGCTLHERG
jgi:hypothetical protein